MPVKHVNICLIIVLKVPTRPLIYNESFMFIKLLNCLAIVITRMFMKNTYVDTVAKNDDYIQL